MNKDHPSYGVALVAGAALAVWAGMYDSTPAVSTATPVTPPVEEPRRL